MPAPTLTSITPDVGGTIGGQAVTLVGTNFTGATGVTIGGAACTSVVVVDATTITCVTPAGTRGAASVVVTNGSGSNGANTLYIYLAAVQTYTYIYLKGGRGDGFVPGWTGEYRDATISVKSDPYRDIFPSSKFALANGAAAANYDHGFWPEGTQVFNNNAAAISKLSDEVSHTAPRQYDRDVTHRFYMSSSGIEYHFELAQISGVGSEPRDE